MKGYFTVYATLSMTVLLSLYLTLLEGVRSNAIRMEAECVTQIALDSILAEYHRELFKQYNLLMTDTSYGTSQPSVENTAEHLREYWRQNTGTQDVFLGGFLYRDFLKMEAEKIDVTKVSYTADGEGTVFRNCAIEAIKDDVGLELLEEINRFMQTVEVNGLRERDIWKEKQEIDRQIQEKDGEEIQISEKEWITIDIQNPTEKWNEKHSTGILSLVVDDVGQVSEAVLPAENLIEERKRQGVLNQGNMEMEPEGGELLHRFLFQEYLIRYMGHYGMEQEQDVLKYQLEYLINGEPQDLENLKKTVNGICMIREAANAIYIFSDEVKCGAAEIVGTALASAMMVPEIAPLLKTTILLAWAYAESLYDVKCLLAGERVPLLKDEQSWHYDLEGILNACLPGDGVSDRESGGQSYEDYLRMMMMWTDLEALTFRAMNLVEADIRNTPGNKSFRLDGCFEALEVKIWIKSDYGSEFTIQRKAQYF